MKKGIIGKKIGMTQIFDEIGNVVPVTVIEAGPCVVAQKKTAENDGYDAVQLGFMDVKEKHLTKAEKGHFDKANVAPKKHLKEFRLDDCSGINVGDIISVDTFAAGRQGRRNRDYKGPRLHRCSQALGQPYSQNDPRYRPYPPSGRFDGC